MHFSRFFFTFPQLGPKITVAMLSCCLLLASPSALVSQEISPTQEIVDTFPAYGVAIHVPTEFSRIERSEPGLIAAYRHKNGFPTCTFLIAAGPLPSLSVEDHAKRVLESYTRVGLTDATIEGSSAHPVTLKEGPTQLVQILMSYSMQVPLYSRVTFIPASDRYVIMTEVVPAAQIELLDKSAPFLTSVDLQSALLSQQNNEETKSGPAQKSALPFLLSTGVGVLLLGGIGWRLLKRTKEE